MRVFAGSDLRLSAAVIGVARLAFLPEEVTSGGHVGRVGAERIRPLLRRLGDTRVQKPSCDGGFDLRLPGSDARKTRNDALVKSASQEDHGEYGDSCNKETFARHLKASVGNAGANSRPTAEVGGIAAANADCRCGGA